MARPRRIKGEREFGHTVDGHTHECIKRRQHQKALVSSLQIPISARVKIQNKERKHDTTWLVVAVYTSIKRTGIVRSLSLQTVFNRHWISRRDAHCNKEAPSAFDSNHQALALPIPPQTPNPKRACDHRCIIDPLGEPTTVLAWTLFDECSNPEVL